MTHQWDEFSKSLACPVPRRESLRRLGLLFAGALLSPLGPRTTWARGSDPCKTFCKCRKSSQQNACLAACKACSGDTRRLCGTCGSYVCCGNGQTCCGRYCANLANDVYNCGACGNVCPQPGPNEFAACVKGRCAYTCAPGTVRCNGVCTSLNSDPKNCGACGNTCPATAPACVGGTCSECSGGSTNCGGYCVFLAYDPYNCGACGFVCPGTGCIDGVCDFGSPLSDW